MPISLRSSTWGRTHFLSLGWCTWSRSSSLMRWFWLALSHRIQNLFFFALSHSLRNTPPYFIEALSKWLNWSNHSLDWSEPCIFFMSNPLDDDIVFCSCESSLLQYCDKSGPGAWQGCLYSRPLNFETFQCLQKQKRCQCCHWSHCWLGLQL